MDRLQSPLHRGLGSDKVTRVLISDSSLLQSPLHRGLGSDVEGKKTKRIGYFVTIPSSSGPGFGPEEAPVAEEEVGTLQSPLHRGLGSDEFSSSHSKCRKKVSIPSSSGPGFGLCMDTCVHKESESFNPLFIGAWVRTEEK